MGIIYSCMYLGYQIIHGICSLALEGLNITLKSTPDMFIERELTSLRSKYNLLARQYNKPTFDQQETCSRPANWEHSSSNNSKTEAPSSSPLAFAEFLRKTSNNLHIEDIDSSNFDDSRSYSSFVGAEGDYDNTDESNSYSSASRQ